MDVALVEARLIVVLVHCWSGVAPAEPCGFGATEGSVEQQQQLEQRGVFEALWQVHFAALCAPAANPTSERNQVHLS